MKPELGSAALISWYWNVGYQRQGRYALGTGTWLDDIYSVNTSVSLISSAAAAARPCVAIWGPSQAGKSTLLSRYFDARSNANVHSALQWSSIEPVVFLGREDTPKGCVQLNPYNQGKDASGCVSRFMLKESIEDPAHPIEVRFAGSAQLMHSLAAGFLSECNQQNAANGEVFFNQSAINDLLARYDSVQVRPPSRTAYEQLREVVDIVEDLARAQWPRYRNLLPSWSTIRPRILEHRALLSSPDLVDDFAFKLFWNAETNVNSVFQELRRTVGVFGKVAVGKKVLCSYSVAKLFLNISSYALCSQNQTLPPEFDIRYTVTPTAVLLDHTAPDRLFTSTIDFGLLQGLVTELVFPVKSATLAETAPTVHAFLEKADILDFPGVALAMPGGAKPTAASLSAEQLLTEVLKRGKTASVVASRAKQFGIDSFCMLIRMASPPAQPDQLIHGIDSWLDALNLQCPPQGNEAPLNLVLTFAAKVVNDQVFALRNNRGAANFEDVFSWLNQLGPIATSKWPKYFAVTYPHLPQGRIDASPDELEKVYQQISEHKAFMARFGNPSESLRQMFVGGTQPDGDGGVDYLLKQLADQVSRSRVPELRTQRACEIQDRLIALFNEALPLDNSEQRKMDLRAWKDSILSAIKRIRKDAPEGDAAMAVSLLLRQTLNVDPKLLEPIPLNCATTDVTPYVGRQYNARWLQHRRQQLAGATQIGLTDQTKAERLLGYLCEYALTDRSVAQWIRSELGHLTQRQDADYARRFLATKMGDTLCLGTQGRRAHRQFSSSADGKDETVASRLATFAASEALSGLDRKDEDSPHYKGFIEPFLQHLDTVATASFGERPQQPGDEQLRLIRAEQLTPAS